MTDDVTAYQSLAETLDGDEDRWAFGSAGAGPAATASDVQVTAPAPVGVDASDVATYCLMLADDALVASQRLAEWTTNAPELEEEVALANCALDLLGQARVLLSRAGHLGAAEAYRRGDGPEDRDTERSGAGPEDRDTERSGAGPEDEDLLTFFRDERAFRHVTLAEVDPGDFGRTVAWMLLFSSWRLALMVALRASADPVLAAVAAKAVPELTYHRDYAAQWMLRLGDGTEESHRRVQAGLDAVWPHVEELFGLHEVEGRLLDAGVAVDPTTLRADVDAVLDAVLPRATLTRPERPAVGLIAGKGGRDGIHTEVFGPVLAQMQSLARAHPGATW